MGPDWDLGQATEFLVVAATLLDLKAARLLPTAEVEDEEDLALLEARDLLFARLLQYRAYKEAAALVGGPHGRRGDRGSRARWAWSRGSPGCCPRCCSTSGRTSWPRLAARAMAPAPVPMLPIDHVHAPAGERARAGGAARRPAAPGAAARRSGRWSPTPGHAARGRRFLALLELYRESAVVFEQVDALAELHVRWIGSGRRGARRSTTSST